MEPTAAPDVTQLVARFFEQRRDGRRISIDELLSDVPDAARRSAVRDSALRIIVQRIRSGEPPSSAASVDGAGVAGAAEAEALPQPEGYDLIEEIGRGGMGVVYEAYQRSTGRRVALKFMSEVAGATPGGRRRFEREVELVARLQHPNIVSVLDSGVHRGREFFVMEYVEGVPLDRWDPEAECRGAISAGLGARPMSGRRSTSGLDALLRLLASVCDAVDYAHQRGVLHRDLKPSNILVDGGGAPHLLDFGLAKAIDAAMSGRRELSLTGSGSILGTLGYMPPEQARGQYEQVSVRSDVYSLGAIAYELLAGRLPLDVGGPIDQVVRRIGEVDPPAPSQAARRASRRGSKRSAADERGSAPGNRAPRFISADLDAVVLKALAKAPAQRYATAAELAADIRRVLADQPVLARPVGWPTRGLRWVRRNRAVSAVAAAAIVVVAGVATGAFIRVAGERDKARYEADTARQVNTFLNKTFELADPRYGSGPEMTVHEMLDRAVQYIDRTFPERPEVEADLRETIGTTYYSLGQLDLAREQLQRALALRRRLYPGDDVRIAVVMIRLLQAEFARGDYAAVAALHAEALPLCRKHVQRNERMLDGMLTLATIWTRTGELQRADALLNELLDVQQRYHGSVPAARAAILVELGFLAIHERDPVRAEARAREAVQILRQHDEPSQSRLSWALATLCGALLEQKRFDEAEEAQREALEINERVYGPGNLNAGTHRYQLAAIRLLRGDGPGAEALHREALAIFRQHRLGDDSPYVAQARFALAELLGASGRLEEARQLFEQVLAAYRGCLGLNRAELHHMLGVYANFLRVAGDLPGADATFREAIDVCAQFYGEESIEMAMTLHDLAMCRDAQGAADAESLARRSLDLQRRLGGDERPDTINTLNTLASILNRQGRFEECETLLDEALAVARKTLGQDNPMVALLLLNLGSYRIERLDFAGAEPPLREALAINRARREPEHPEVFGSMYRLAWACGKLDMGDDAEAMFREALSTARRALPASDPQLGDVLLAYGEFVLEHVGAAAAEPLLCEGLAIYEVSNPGVDWLADARLLLGRCLLAQRRFDEAEPLLVGGYGVLREIYGAAHPKTCAAFDAVVALYESSNDAEKLEALLIDAPAERSAGDARP